MRARPQLPGVQWLLWLHNVPLRVGVLAGIYLSCVFIVWLFVANRVSWLEPFSGARNLVAGALMLLILAIPVLRFRHEPGRLFISGLAAWTLLTLAYMAAELHFTLLETRMGALHVFVMGVISYGLLAVFQWVFSICAECRQRHLSHSGHAPESAERSRTH